MLNLLLRTLERACDIIYIVTIVRQYGDPGSCGNICASFSFIQLIMVKTVLSYVQSYRLSYIF